MNKLLIIILALSIVMGSMVPMIAYGETQLDKDLEATILKIKSLLNIPNDYDGFTQRLESYNNETNYYLNWSDSKEVLPSINISTDEKGFITSLNKYYPKSKSEDNKIPTITKSEAETKALEFIKKIAPSIVTNIKMVENNPPLNSWDDSYAVEFFRLENGIPFYDNRVTVYINKFTGEINNYNAYWNKKIEFKKPNNIITLESGKEAFKNEIGLKLIYKTSHMTFKLPDNRDTNYFLSYSLLSNSKAIDAVTGKPINLNYYSIYANDEIATKVMGISNELTPYEKIEIDKLTGIKDLAEIEKTARKVLEIDESYKLEDNELYSSRNNKDDFIWSLYFSRPVEKDINLRANISLNGKTGEVIDFNKNGKYDSAAKPIINKEHSLELAKEYLKKISLDKVDEVEYMETVTKDDEQSYVFNFIRKTNDIYIENDSINIGVDAVNKNINSYSLNWFKGELPTVDKNISLEDAYSVLFNDIGYELKYVAMRDINKVDNEKEEAILIYGLKSDKPAIISPINGELLDYNGKSYKDNQIMVYEDIEDSYAKTRIETLSQHGISFSNSKFRPKDAMKQSDFLYLLWKTQFSYRNDSEDLIKQVYEDLVAANIVRDGEENPERIITKEEGVKYIIRTMKYDKIADMSNIFKKLWNDESDISEGLNGYLNIAYGLKLINGGNNGDGNIFPLYELKREDGANMIYNYMFVD